MTCRLTLKPFLANTRERLVGLVSGLSISLISASDSFALSCFVIRAMVQADTFFLTVFKSSSKVIVTTFRLDKSRAQVCQPVAFRGRVGFVTSSSIAFNR
jgi:hypothetical protein